MRHVLTALLLLSCTGDQPATDAEIHEHVACDASWDGHHNIVSRAYCEAPCVDLGQLGTHGQCEIGGTSCPAGKYINWHDRVGCCVDGDDGGPVVLFVECDK